MSLLDNPIKRSYYSWFKRLPKPQPSKGTKAKYNQYGVYQMSFSDLKKHEESRKFEIEKIDNT